MADRYFTPEEANAALADVRPLAERMVVHGRELARVQARQAEFLQLIAGNGGDLTPSELRETQRAVERETEAVAKYLEELQGLGAQVKDVVEGLVDFPALREGEEVLLCWRVGEDEIAYWHPVDEGFAGRRPLPL